MKVDQDFYDAILQMQRELQRAGLDIPATDLTAILGRWLQDHPPNIIVVVPNKKRRGKGGLEEILPFVG